MRGFESDDDDDDDEEEEDTTGSTVQPQLQPAGVGRVRAGSVCSVHGFGDDMGAEADALRERTQAGVPQDESGTSGAEGGGGGSGMRPHRGTATPPGRWCTFEHLH